jgi:hypothetical protein
MKKTAYFLVALSIVMFFASCLSMKKDCQGRKHQRQPNGVYL